MTLTRMWSNEIKVYLSRYSDATTARSSSCFRILKVIPFDICIPTGIPRNASRSSDAATDSCNALLAVYSIPPIRLAATIAPPLFFLRMPIDLTTFIGTLNAKRCRHLRRNEQASYTHFAVYRLVLGLSLNPSTRFPPPYTSNTILRSVLLHGVISHSTSNLLTWLAGHWAFLLPLVLGGRFDNGSVIQNVSNGGLRNANTHGALMVYTRTGLCVRVYCAMVDVHKARVEARHDTALSRNYSVDRSRIEPARKTKVYANEHSA